MSIHKSEIIPINLCFHSCFRGDMCTVIVKEDYKKKTHSKLCLQLGHLNAKQNISFNATLCKNNFVYCLVFEGEIIIVCFLQSQTRINIKSDLMFGTILDSELTKRTKLAWNKTRHWMIADTVCYLFNHDVLFHSPFYSLPLMCALLGIYCAVF